MSNRTLGFLIIFGFIMGLYAFYEYYFVYNTVNLKIISNQSNYSVELYNKKLLSINNYVCSQKECEINGISPFKYDIKILKKGFKDFKSNIDLSKSKKIFINLERISKISLEDELLTDLSKQKTLKVEKNVINNDFIFKEKGKLLNIYYRGLKIGSFDYKDSYNIYKILGDDRHVLFVLGNQKYILNLEFYDFKKLNFDKNILYIKKMKNFTYQLITADGTFLYDIMKDKIEYVDKFYDFVFLNNNFIGYIKNNDNRRKKNLGFEDKTGNIIIKYNQDTKEKILLESIDFEIKKIYKKDSSNYVYLQDIDGKEYKIDIQ